MLARKTLFTLLFLLTSFSMVMAQNANITGKLVSKEEGLEEPIPFANVVLEGTSIGSTTDFDGMYNITVKPGTYTLLFSYVGFEDGKVEVTVGANETATINHTLKSSSITMEAVNVVQKANRESTAIQMLERKNAAVLTESLGSQKLAEKGVSNAVEGLTKVSGVSKSNGRYFLVRGLGDRYNNAMLNGMPIASPDPDKKVIPLDLFSSNVIQSLAVYKSYSPQYYGDVAGGTVEVKTKDYTEDLTLKVGSSVGMNTQATFKNFMTYDNGENSYLGLNKNDRSIPNEVENIESYESQENGLAFETNNNATYQKAPLANSHAILFSNFFSQSEDNSKGLGVLVSANYGNSYGYQDGNYKLVNKQGIVRNDYRYERFGFATNTSLLGNVVYKFNNDHKIKFTSLFLNLSQDEARRSVGTHFDYESEINARRYTYKQHSLWSNQVTGEHVLKGGRLQFDWAQTYAKATSDEPDRRQFVFLRGENGELRFNDIDINENHRFFSSLEENEFASKAAVKYKLKMSEEDADKAVWTVDGGVNLRFKKRDFDFRQFNYNVKNFTYPTGGLPSLDNIDDYLNASTHEDGVFEIQEQDAPASANQSELNIAAFYVNSDYELIPYKLRLLAGLRLESGNQSIEFRDQQQPVFLVKNNLSSLPLLPAFSLKYTPAKQQVWWLTASKTLSRPGFKEIAPFEYREFFSSEIIVGNPNLQNGTNYNADLRYEFYPSPTELISVAAFGKYLDSPIERVNIAASSGRLQTFANIDKAVLAGIEIELSKKLFSSADFKNTVSTGVNAAYLYSQVSIEENMQVGGVSVAVTNTERPLQGASPYLINGDITYQRDGEKFKGTATLVYNVFGPRIQAIGIKAGGATDGTADVYELPAQQLDLILKGSFNNKLGISLTAKNILNPEFVREQDTDLGTIQLNRFQKGTRISFGVSYNIF